MKKGQIFKEGLYVTLGSLLAMVVAFGGYFLLFMLIARVFSQSGSYYFVAWLRMGYGILWLLFGAFFYKMHGPDWLKASLLAAALTTFFASSGVQFFANPLLAGLILVLTASIVVFLLYRARQPWYHYYAVALALLAAWFYL